MDVSSKLKSVLGYATFPSKEIRQQVVKVLDSHHDDLDDVGYQPSVRTEDEVKELDRILNEYDEKNTPDRETLREALREAREEEEEESEQS